MEMRESPAPEGAHRRTRGKVKEYPPAVGRRGADGKMERVSLSVIRKEYKMLNRDMFALTFGQQDIQFQLWLTFWLVHWQNISLLQQMTADIVIKPKN